MTGLQNTHRGLNIEDRGSRSSTLNGRFSGRRSCLVRSIFYAILLLSILYPRSSIFVSAPVTLRDNVQTTMAADIQASSNVPAPEAGQKKVVLKNLGMSCVFCKAAVSAKLKQLPGVVAYDVDLKSDSATVLYDPGKVTIEKLKQAIAETGFQVRAVEEVAK